MHKRSKKKNMKSHFAQRSLERVGLLLDEASIVRKIQKNELECIRRQSNRVTVFKYEFHEKLYQVVYDKTRKQIITIMFYNDEKSLPFHDINTSTFDTEVD